MITEGESFSLRIFEEDQVRHLLAREVHRATRYQDFLCLCLVRPDYSGLPVGARQRALAREIVGLLRGTDIVGLIGDDIAVLLVHTPRSEGVLIGERIRERVAAAQAPPSIPVGGVGLQIALSCFPTDSTADTGLLAHAQAQFPDATGRP